MILIRVTGGAQERELLAPPCSRTLPPFSEKRSEGVEVGESLPPRFIEEAYQHARGGQGISVGSVAVRDIDPVVPRHCVEIPALQPREKAARHLDRTKTLDVGNLSYGLRELPTDETPVEARIMGHKNPALEVLHDIVCDVVEEGRG